MYIQIDRHAYELIDSWRICVWGGGIAEQVMARQLDTCGIIQNVHNRLTGALTRTSGRRKLSFVRGGGLDSPPPPNEGEYEKLL